MIYGDLSGNDTDKLCALFVRDSARWIERKYENQIKFEISNSIRSTNVCHLPLRYCVTRYCVIHKMSSSTESFL